MKLILSKSLLALLLITSSKIAASYEFLSQIHYQAAGEPDTFQSYLDNNRSRINREFWSCFSQVEQKLIRQAQVVDANCKRYNVRYCQNPAVLMYQWMQNIRPVLEGKARYSNTKMYQEYEKVRGQFNRSFLENSARMSMPVFRCN